MRCLGSLHLATPHGELYLCSVLVESLREWLSQPEGPDLIDTHTDSQMETFHALAIGLDPEFLYGTESVVGLGVVLKPHYINTISFDVAAGHFRRWLGQASSNRLTEPCLLFFSLSMDSKVFPLCKGFPYLIDVSSGSLEAS